MKPFKSDQDSDLAISLSYSLQMIFLSALLIKVNATSEDKEDQHTFGVLLILVFAASPIYLAVQNLRFLAQAEQILDKMCSKPKEEAEEEKGDAAKDVEAANGIEDADASSKAGCAQLADSKKLLRSNSSAKAVKTQLQRAPKNVSSTTIATMYKSHSNATSSFDSPSIGLLAASEPHPGGLRSRLTSINSEAANSSTSIKSKWKPPLNGAPTPLEEAKKEPSKDSDRALVLRKVCTDRTRLVRKARGPSQEGLEPVSLISWIY